MTEIAPEFEEYARSFAADWAGVFLSGVDPRDNFGFVRRLIFCSFAAGVVMQEFETPREINDLFINLFAKEIDDWLHVLESAEQEL